MDTAASVRQSLLPAAPDARAPKLGAMHGNALQVIPCPLLLLISPPPQVIHLLSDASAMVTGAVLDISPDVIPGMMPDRQG